MCWVDGTAIAKNNEKAIRWNKLHHSRSQIIETQTFNTVCTECIFNDYGPDKAVNCLLGKYEKYRERGELGKDGQILRLCSSCRNADWEDRSDEDSEERLNKELKGVYSILIVDDNHHGVLERLEKTLSNSQTLTPKQIVIVYIGDTPLSSVLSMANSHIEQYKDRKVKINVQRAMEARTVRELIDLGAKTCDGLMMVICENGDTLEKDTLSKIHTVIETDLTKLIFIHPYSFGVFDRVTVDWKENLTGMVIHRAFFEMVNGNYSLNVEEKLKEAIDLEKNDHCSLTWSDILAKP